MHDGLPSLAPVHPSRAMAIREALGQRHIVMVGLMGCGKTSVGRRTALQLGMPFVDADAAVEEAAGMTIADIFNDHGEDYFRAGERRVIARLLRALPQVLATGGGAYMAAETRAAITASGIAVWLRADLPVLMKRVSKRTNRPLLRSPDPEAVMRDLIATRYPVYAEASVIVDSIDIPHEAMTQRVLDALAAYLSVDAPSERKITHP